MRTTTPALKQFVIASIMLCAASTGYAVTGNEYRNLSITQRQGWTAGVADGMITQYLMSKNETPPLAKCLGELEREQIRAIFEKSLDAVPEKWNFPAAFVFHSTFTSFCGIK